jgi:hypothetical protein
MHQPKPVIFSVLTGIEINENLSRGDRIFERSLWRAINFSNRSRVEGEDIFCGTMSTVPAQQ